MEKTVPGKWVLYTRHTLNSPMDIGLHASTDEPVLRRKAAESGLKVAGPLEHAYWNMAVDGVPHILEIWLPVEPRASTEESEDLKRVDAYKCLVSEFKRPIQEIGDAWMELGEKAATLNLRTTDHDREVYRVMDCDHPGGNDIELQLGVR